MEDSKPPIYRDRGRTNGYAFTFDTGSLEGWRKLWRLQHRVKALNKTGGGRTGNKRKVTFRGRLGKNSPYRHLYYGKWDPVNGWTHKPVHCSCCVRKEHADRIDVYIKEIPRRNQANSWEEYTDAVGVRRWRRRIVERHVRIEDENGNVEIFL